LGAGRTATHQGRLVTQGGWTPLGDATVFNLYRPPTLVHGEADLAGLWIEHVHRVYPDEAHHIIDGWRTGYSGRQRSQTMRW